MALCRFICSHTVCFVCLPRIFQLLANSDKKCRQYYQQSTSAFLSTERLDETKGCSVGLLPCKDIERSTWSTGGDRCLEGALLPTIRAEYHFLYLKSACCFWSESLKSYTLALHSQSFSITENVWIL